MEYRMEPLKVDDLESIIGLSTIVGWDYTSKEVKVFLEAGTLFGHREVDGRLVSCAGVFSYGKLASIGVVIVHPQQQGKGLGRVLMNRCLDEIDQLPVMLVSTQEGQRLYQSLGYQTVSSIHKLLSDCPIRFPNEPVLSGEISPISYADLDDAIRLDATVIGASRSAFLKSRFPFLNGGIVFRDYDGMLQGYAMTVCRNGLLIVGPIVAPSREVSTAMIRHLTAGWTGRVRIDVPSSQKEFFDTLVSLGFYESERSPVMIRNAAHLPGNRSRLYAIAAQAFG